MPGGRKFPVFAVGVAGVVVLFFVVAIVIRFFLGFGLVVDGRFFLGAFEHPRIDVECPRKYVEGRQAESVLIGYPENERVLEIDTGCFFVVRFHGLSTGKEGYE